MRRIIFTGLFVMSLSLLPGCSSEPFCRQTPVNSRTAGQTGVAVMDLNSLPYEVQIVTRNDGSRDILWQATGRIEQQGPCRIKYHKTYSKNRYMVVEGRIGSSEAPYPVVLDSGASQPLFVKAAHVLNNSLSVYPLKNNTLNLNGRGLGLCNLPDLRIGGVTLADWPCLYLERPTRPAFFGLPLVSGNPGDNTVIVGLPVLRKFKYVLFDNIKQEVEFSSHQPFVPAGLNAWEKYPFVIEEDFHGNTFLFVNIPVAGMDIELQLDTGSGRGLAVTTERWEQLRHNIPHVKLKKKKDFYPYLGRLACRRGSIPKLKVGTRIISDAQISVFPNQSPLLQECQGLLGMQYFEHTVIILDFERDLMWVGNPQDRQPAATDL